MITMNLFHTAFTFIFIAVFAIAIFTIIYKVISGIIDTTRNKKTGKHSAKRTATNNFAHCHNDSDNNFLQRIEMMNDITRQENDRQFNSFINNSIAENNQFMDSMNNAINTINDISMMNMNGFM